MYNSNNQSPWLPLLTGGVFLGFAPIFSRYSELGPIATGLWRMALGLPFLGLIFFVPKSSAFHPFSSGYKQPSVKDLSGMWLLGSIFAIDLVTWHLSLEKTYVANAGVLGALSPLFVTLFSWVLLGLKLDSKIMLAIVCATIGISLLIEGKFEFSEISLQGDAYAILTAIIFAVYLMGLEHYQNKYHPLFLLFNIQLSASVVLLLAAILMGESLMLPALAMWYPLIGLAIIPQILGYAMVAHAMCYFNARFVSFAVLIELAVSINLAWILFGEELSVIQFYGILAIMVSIYMARLSRASNVEEKAELAYQR